MNWGLAKLYTSSKYLPMHTAYSAAVVREISYFFAPEISRWTAEALVALQEVS
ncbi:hypothetical protein CK203_013004 [Vitis vinifera]|uniref:Uncharacterized protein n=1 Tax=Vitis vinifera TaxID=29760 RepID=A0A438JMF9_VITVI|nr:hypothetical protein CK203_013004 [Vitis vinifera]